jgi:hypothetical protein
MRGYLQGRRKKMGKKRNEKRYLVHKWIKKKEEKRENELVL